MNRLLKNIYYGNELSKLEVGSEELRKWFSMAWPRIEGEDALSLNWDAAYANVREYFKRKRDGLFGGPITAGDGLAIHAFMAALRPRSMVEIGVASGFSSAFILTVAEKLGLSTKNEVYLHSLDIVGKRDNGDETGQLLRRTYTHLLPYWQLHAPATSIDILQGHLVLPDFKPVLAFIDGGHVHPWPVADIIAMHSILPSGSWILMQDVQIMERWIADCIIHGVPARTPVRGVQLAVSLWPGTKWIGQGICYNMAALKLDADDEAVRRYIDSSLEYANETDFRYRDILKNAIPAIGS